MFVFASSELDKVSVHQIGNKNNDEGMFLSKQALGLRSNLLKEKLLQFFVKSFTETEFYQFTSSNQDANLNPLFQFSKSVFNEVSDFHLMSINFAKHLYESSAHPQIKSGDFFVATIKNIQVGHQSFDAIGLFKSENKHHFLTLQTGENAFELDIHSGINPDKMDKGCLIFNTKEEDGYMVAIVDKSNKSEEAQYWKYQFLNIKPIADEYYQTKNFLTVAKEYVTKILPEAFEIDKTETIDILNRSVDYFKSHDQFEKEDFEAEIFQSPAIIESFRKFEADYNETHQIEATNSFEINLQAVKKQARIFKSILKLDKNFHIYIHGDKDLIEKGTDPDGRKFYKIYYQNED